MKIVKFNEFIKEQMDGLVDTVETNSEILLKVLKSKIEKMFDEEEVDEDEVMTLKKAKESSKNKQKPTFKEFGMVLDSTEVSMKNKDSLTVKFSDDENTYNLYIKIDIKAVLPEDGQDDFTIDDVKKCYIKFKKYNLDTFEVIGQLAKNVDPKEIDQEFIVNLKLEVDEMFDQGDDVFKIETTNK
jgi:hypothetical protein